MSILQTNVDLVPLASPTFRIPIELRYEDDSAQDGDEPTAPLLVQFVPTVTSVLLGCGATQAFDLVRQLKAPNVNGGWPWPGLTKIKFGSFLGVSITRNRWSTFLQELSDLVELRRNLPGVSVSLVYSPSFYCLVSDVPRCLMQPISVHNHSDFVVEDSLGCAMFLPS